MLTSSDFEQLFKFFYEIFVKFIIFIIIFTATISGLLVYSIMKYKESIKNEQIKTDSRKIDFRKQNDGIIIEK